MQGSRGEEPEKTMIKLSQLLEALPALLLAAALLMPAFAVLA